MVHVFEAAPTGRAKCRGCGQPIEKGAIRFGERIPNPFAEGEATLWFHPLCGAYKRPEAMLEALEQSRAGAPNAKAHDAEAHGAEAQDAEALEKAARGNAAHRRLSRIDGAGRAPTGQARCRHCKEPIGKGEWRIRLVFYEEGRFSPSGFVHLGCREGYFETTEILAPLLHFSRDLGDEDRAALLKALDAPGQS